MCVLFLLNKRRFTVCNMSNWLKMISLHRSYISVIVCKSRIIYVNDVTYAIHPRWQIVHLSASSFVKYASTLKFNGTASPSLFLSLSAFVFSFCFHLLIHNKILIISKRNFARIIYARTTYVSVDFFSFFSLVSFHDDDHHRRRQCSACSEWPEQRCMCKE